MDELSITDLDRQEDLLGCIRAYTRAFAAPPWNEHWPEAKARGRLVEIAGTPNSQFLVAQGRGRVVGLLAGYVETFYPADRFQLAELAVDPSHQRQGIASRLVTELVHRLAELDVAEVFLITGRSGAARDFWQSQSFAMSKGRIVMARRMS